jgi:hypothetical protein
MTPIVVVLLGQSNLNGVQGPSPLSLAKDHAGAVVVDNGELLTDYNEKVGPEPWVVDELRELGRQPTLIIRATNGAPLGHLCRTSVPEVLADLAARDLKPDAFVVVHGERDSSDEKMATTYQERLVGPTQGPRGCAPTVDGSLLEKLHEAHPGVPLVITEMRHDYDNYGAFHERIRAEQREAAQQQGVCLVPTMDLDLADRVHYSLDGLEGLGRRVAKQIVEGCE